jgi:hypothetical protein
MLILKKPAPAPAPAPKPAVKTLGTSQKLFGGIKKAQPAPEPEEEPEAPPPKPGLKMGVKPPATKLKPTASASKLAFVKKGSTATQVLAQEEMKAEQRSKDNVFSFWLPPNGEGQITFLDGEVKDGTLDIPFFHQHSVFMNGSYNNHFICTGDSEPCPICEGGDAPSFVGILTVIDHGEYTSKKDGKVYKDNIRKFVAKRGTIKNLLKIANKRGGLTGCTFDVSRTGDKEPGCGNQFDFVEKRTLPKLQAIYGTKDKAITPLDYNALLGAMYLPAEQLRKLGFGSSQPPIGSEKAMTEEEYDETMQ